MPVNWKRHEIVIAKAHGCKRTPLSGGNGRITRADMIHPKIFLDNKNSRTGHAAANTLEEIRKRAKAEDKVGVLTLTGGRKHGYVYCIHSEDIVSFLRALAEDLDFVQQAVCDESVLSADTLYFGPTLGSRQEKSTVEKIEDVVAVQKRIVRVKVRCEKKKIIRRQVRAEKSGQTKTASPSRRQSLARASA